MDCGRGTTSRRQVKSKRRAVHDRVAWVPSLGSKRTQVTHSGLRGWTSKIQ